MARRLRLDAHGHAQPVGRHPVGIAASLTFWLHIDSAETTTSVQYDKLTVKVGSTTVATYSNLNKAAGYSQKMIDLSAYAG